MDSSLLFFFSSRRRHTRSLRDWSSDVCSSEREIDFAARRESPLKIAKKKIPFAWSPARVARPISIKTDRKRGDPIELLVKIRERLERLNSENRSWHAENYEQFLEERRFVKVEAKNGMTESFQNEQKKAATTA